LEVPKFFRRFFPIASADEIREEAFVLYYYSEGGVKYGDIEEMETVERAWNLKRLSRQKQAELSEAKKAQKSHRARRRR
jgi:hypothetical protein